MLVLYPPNISSRIIAPKYYAHTCEVKDFIKSGTYPPPWTARDQRVDNVYYANDTDMLEGNKGPYLKIQCADRNTGIGGTHGIGVPMQVYPLYENGLRAHQGQTIRANHEESAKLYAKYAHVASNNPMAWNYGGKPETETSIRTITKRNRMICFPCAYLSL